MSIARNGFQRFVNRQLPPAVAGDFAGAGLRTFAPAGPGGFRAGSGGVSVGRFAWAAPATGIVTNAQQSNALLGFVHRENQALITQYLGYASELVPEGYMLTLMLRGEFWARFAGSVVIPDGSSVYANPTTGEASISSGGGNVLTPFKVIGRIPVDAAFTGVIDANGILTVSTVTAGVVEAGLVLNGTGVAENTFITEQLSGTAGADGTYQTTLLKVVASTAMTANSGRLAKISTWQVN